MIWDGDQYAIEGDGPLDTALIENVTVDGMAFRGIYASGGPFVMRNTIVTGSPSGDFMPGSGGLSGSNNTSTDASASFGANAQTGVTAAASYVTPNVNLHLKAGAVAIDSGLDLAPSFFIDIDAGVRPGGLGWDRGADEFGVTTEVRLQSFVAVPGDASVVLEWRTASELDNLGFHLYRGPSSDGPWARLTASLMPGLGSSATGQAYSFRDAGLQNGTRYFYRLEDVDAGSKTTSHGPVSAVPTIGAPGGAPGSEPPSSASAKTRAAARRPAPTGWWRPTAPWLAPLLPRPRSRARATGIPRRCRWPSSRATRGQATLELRTGGFYALHEASGQVRVFVPGFDLPQDPQAPGLPYRRALVEALVGRSVQLGGVRALEQVSFPGLVPSAFGKLEMQVSRDGTVRAGRRALRESSPRHVSLELARLLPSVFQGETKSAVVSLTPLRYDSWRGQLVLSKRLLVRLLFTGRETGESGRGSHGRERKNRQAVSGRAPGAALHHEPRAVRGVVRASLPGQRARLAASQLRLERQGQPEAFHLEPASASFGPGSVLYFHAEQPRRLDATSRPRRPGSSCVRATASDAARLGGSLGRCRHGGVHGAGRLRNRPFLSAGAARGTGPVAVGGPRLWGDAREELPARRGERELRRAPSSRCSCRGLGVG